MTAKFNIQKVLIAPLDWGLGHATRCIPIIKALQDNEIEVVIGAEGAVAALLQQEFPDITIIPLRGYRVQYAGNRMLLIWKLLAQLPSIYKTIRAENNWLKKVVAEEKIQLIISDNRFGLYHATVPSVFITHQLNIKAPFNWVENILRSINYSFINRFTTCWVPDAQETPGLAGSLSHPKKLPSIPVHYINLLSRFTPQLTHHQFSLGIILSGPEPQRTILENKVMAGLAAIKEPVFLLRGKPQSTEVPIVPANVQVFNHLPTIALQQLVQQTEYIVCRGGYTSLMELLSLQKKLIIIPTPQQTEQEYLAKQLMQQQLAMFIEQPQFVLANAYEQAQQFHFKELSIPIFKPEYLLPLLRKAIE